MSIFTNSYTLVEDQGDNNNNNNNNNNETLICAPIIAKNVTKMLLLINKAKEQGADLVELRLDYLHEFNPVVDLPFLLDRTCLPTLVTFRPTWEGGQYDGNEDYRQHTLRMALDLGANYIDIELKVANEFFESINGKLHEKSKIIVSYHNYENTSSSEELGDLVVRIQLIGAHIVKISTTALDITDSANILETLSRSQVPIIGLVMGEKGLISRILCAKFGGYMTFGSVEDNCTTLGYPTIKDLLDLYNFRGIGVDTQVLGVIGNPIAQSKSPHLYNVGFKSLGFDAIYLPLLVDNVALFLATFSSLDFVGYSFTIPHKVAGLECCDVVDPIAKEIGAISCMIKRPRDGKLLGYNIDYMGAVEAIREGLLGLKRDGSNGNNTRDLRSIIAGKTMVIIGAGGAGKALAYGGKTLGAKLVITDYVIDIYFDMISEKAEELAKKVGGQVISLSELDDFAPGDGSILANATPIGMQPNINDMPIATKALKHYSLVFDAIYTPKMTRLLREAKRSGAKIAFGSEMFVNQAFIQFEKFTGLPAPRELMREVLERNSK